MAKQRIVLLVIAVIVAAGLLLSRLDFPWRPSPQGPTPEAGSPASLPELSLVVEIGDELRRYQLPGAQFEVIEPSRALGIGGARVEIPESRIFSLFHTGDSVVFLRGGRVFSFEHPRYGIPLDLGPANSVFPGRTRGKVWMTRRTEKGLEVGEQSVHRFGADSVAELRSGEVPVAEVDRGLISVNETQKGARLSLLDRRTFEVKQKLATDGVFLAASGSFVAWSDRPPCPSSRCTFRLLDLFDGTSHQIEGAEGSFGFVEGGAFSESRAHLAVFVLNESRSLQSLFLIDTRKGSGRVIPGTEFNSAGFAGRAEWFVDRVFYGTGFSEIGVHRLGDTTGEKTGISSSWAFIAI
ncbi:MAG: hypothetical protein KY429_06160 [Actinobacteria bacterium]|nr:hypothetical protein [Actinomycetota bacterium]